MALDPHLCQTVLSTPANPTILKRTVEKMNHVLEKNR